MHVLLDNARLAIKRRNNAEAAARLERVVAKNPTHTAAHYQLFLMYSRLKQPEKAEAELKEFKRLDALEKQSMQERRQDEQLRVRRITGREQ